MFSKNSTDIVLIGEPYRSEEKFTLVDSKIGGLPVWQTEEPEGYPFHCSVCGKEMCLLMQVYEPTSALDRVLYVFCCKSSSCQLSPQGWRCIRQQTAVQEEDVKEEEVKPAAKPAISTGLSWDFGSSSTGSALSFSFGPTASSNVSTKSTSSASVSANADLLSLLSKMEKKTGTTSDSQAFSAPNPSVPSNSQSSFQSKSSKSKTKSPSKAASADQTSHPQVPELFIDIFDEPEAKAASHKPGNAKKASELTVERGEGELYDHDKKMSRLLKFQSTIQRCPSQVVRIAYPNGQPLFPSTAQLPAIPRCECGAARVFELQILPTVLSFLPADEPVSLESLTNEEWSSVLLYTCANHCHRGDSAADETVVVLPPL